MERLSDSPFNSSADIFFLLFFSLFHPKNVFSHSKSKETFLLNGYKSKLGLFFIFLFPSWKLFCGGKSVKSRTEKRKIFLRLSAESLRGIVEVVNGKVAEDKCQLIFYSCMITFDEEILAQLLKTAEEDEENPLNLSVGNWTSRWCYQQHILNWKCLFSLSWRSLSVRETNLLHANEQKQKQKSLGHQTRASSSSAFLSH